MRVLIVGAGNMGRGSATRLAAGSNALTLFDVDPARSQGVAS
jgi:Trk K+ transport system NAD-binding subunit